MTYLIRICVKFAVVIGIYVLFQKYKEAGSVCQIATHDCTHISENDAETSTISAKRAQNLLPLGAQICMILDYFSLIFRSLGPPGSLLIPFSRFSLIFQDFTQIWVDFQLNVQRFFVFFLPPKFSNSN